MHYLPDYLLLLHLAIKLLLYLAFTFFFFTTSYMLNLAHNRPDFVSRQALTHAILAMGFLLAARLN